MRNNKKHDDLSVNAITSQNNIKPAPDGKNAGNATNDPYCVYAHQRHAVGSKIKNHDGSEMVCTEDGSWQNSKRSE